MPPAPCTAPQTRRTSLRRVRNHGPGGVAGLLKPRRERQAARETGRERADEVVAGAVGRPRLDARGGLAFEYFERLARDHPDELRHRL